MKRIFYTFDTLEYGCGTIDENANIKMAFVENDTTDGEIKALMLEFAEIDAKPFSFNINVLKRSGRCFMDCWKKSYDTSVEEITRLADGKVDSLYAPFLAEELNIKPPGSHQGDRNCHWVTPNVDVDIYTFTVRAPKKRWWQRIK